MAELSANPLQRPLEPYLSTSSDITWDLGDFPVCRITRNTPGLDANRRYFDRRDWAQKYFESCHRDAYFRSRWQAATGSWNGKIVVDVGCGPGNVFATVGGKPKTLIGVDVSGGALRMARELGYQSILADAQNLPFISGFAEIVAVNASLHHCDDMDAALSEAARLVAPGGMLITDHDPQLSAWNFRGPARWAWNLRLTAYRWLKKGFHASVEEQTLALQGEIHHVPGSGVTEDLYHRVLGPLNFDVDLCFHNNEVGASALHGEFGRSRFRYRIAQAVSGINPNSRDGALSILCRAKKRH
jgi:ubiquinone/menaquinone biosynthesis C-methylase UbiE